MTEQQQLTTEKLAVFCKQKGILFQAADIYGGLAGFFDLGPLGVELSTNIKQSWWKHFIRKREDVVGQDGSIITNPKVWKASGHVDNFSDPVLITKKTKQRIRADHFIEQALGIPADGMTAQEMQELIEKKKLTYKGEEFEDLKDFNLMFSTQVGADPSSHATAYLRPETCQSIFPNFKLIAETARLQLPFGIAQIGKAFRNEISPRDFIFRCREFEQIELEYFFNPKTESLLLTQEHKDIEIQFLSAQAQEKETGSQKKTTIGELVTAHKINTHHAYWLAEYYLWFTKQMKLSEDNLRVREHMENELSHYSSATVDIEYKFPMGFKEMFGLANRGNFDLSQHQEHAKSKLEIMDNTTQEKVLPHVIEPSLGVGRLMMAILCESYCDDTKRGNIVLELPSCVVPYQVAVFPLVNKGGLPEQARAIFETLLDEDLTVYYDRSGSVGRRYARQDEIGTPFCITVDFETLEEGEQKGTVTIRNRTSTTQERVAIEEVVAYLKKQLKN